MKRLFNYIFVIIAAMVTFAGCEMSIIDESVAPETKTVQFYANSIETKTAFGTPDGITYPTLWSEGDKVKILVNLASVANTEKSVAVVCSDDYKSASFVVDLAEPDAETYTFYSISPAVALLEKSTEKLYVQIPAEQEPLETSVDEDAQLLYAASETAETMPECVELAYRHLTSYGKMSLSNLTTDISSVSSIKIEASEDIYLAGKWDYFVADGSFVVRSDKGSNSITLATSKTTDIWFACAPVDMSGKKMILTVTTDKGDLVKEITFPENRKFEAGRIAKFTVDMDGIEVDTPDTPEDPEETTQYFEKVTSAPSDWSGKYLIVFETINSCWDGSLNCGTSTGQLGHIAGSKDVKITDNKIAYNDSYFSITKTRDSYTVTTASGYCIGNEGNSNGLKSGDYTNNITLNTDGTVNITSSDEYTQVAYNSSAKYIRFYKNTTVTNSKYPLPVLYKLIEGDTGENEGGETPEPELQERNLQFSVTTTTATVGEEFVEPTLTGATDGVTYSSSNTSVATVNESTGEVTLVAKGETTITATAAADATYKAGEASYALTVSAGSQGGETSKTWKLVTDASTLTAGDKLAIVSSSKGKVAGSLTSQYLASIAVTITGNAFSTLPSGAVEFTLGGASGAWTMAGSDGKLLGATAVKKLAWGSGTTTWSISIEDNGDATIQNVTSTYGRFLYNVNSPRFTTYTSEANSGMLLPQIYRYE